jgi:hypothetical protein
MPDTSAGGGGEDPEGAFDRSLGDFDGEIARERAAIASAGKGSGRVAQGREAGDARAVKTAGAGGRDGDAPAAGTADIGGAPVDTGGGEDSGIGTAGAGTQGPPGEGPVAEGDGKGGTGSGESGAAGDAAAIPADIPADGAGEDQVARQLREAAIAEKDPVVREALWEQYRRHTGMRP